MTCTEVSDIDNMFSENKEIRNKYSDHFPQVLEPSGDDIYFACPCDIFQLSLYLYKVIGAASVKSPTEFHSFQNKLTMLVKRQ